ncbi:MAG TPA: DinB family protein [Mucilaginibacter sp.]
MTKVIDILIKPRVHILNILKEFTLAQLNEVPTGFNNNILWNLGHMVAAQQNIFYGKTVLPKLIDDTFFMAYKPESKPEKFIDAGEYENIKSLLFSTLDQLAIDMQNNIFANYPAWTTRYGIEITSADDAIHFLPFHEGLHIGYIMSLRKMVSK